MELLSLVHELAPPMASFLSPVFVLSVLHGSAYVCSLFGVLGPSRCRNSCLSGVPRRRVSGYPGLFSLSVCVWRVYTRV